MEKAYLGGYGGVTYGTAEAAPFHNDRAFTQAGTLHKKQIDLIVKQS
jgi:hypothetical protein